jgi:hypothetical protein
MLFREFFLPLGGGQPPYARAKYTATDQTLAHAWEVPMSDDPTEVIKTAIHSAFVGYPKEDDPDSRSPSWIKPQECTHLTKVIMEELEANGFQIVKKKAA